MASIGIVVQTCNEAEYLEDCLVSARWADQLVVVDQQSTDATLDICSRYADKVVSHVRVPVVELTRDFAMSQVDCDWVLVLDPDERVSEDLSYTLRDVITQPSMADGYYLRFRTRMFKRDILHSGWDKDEHLRFFRRGKCVWPARVHSNPELDGVASRIPESCGYIIHENYKDIDQFISKLNRYTEFEASRLMDEGRSFHWMKLFYQPSKEFFSRYIQLRGYKDGLPGLLLALLRAFYVQATYMKLWEAQEIKGAKQK